jgi:hypothetical protein
MAGHGEHHGFNRPRHKLKAPAPIGPGPYVCHLGHEVHDHDVSRGVGGELVGLCWTCRRENTAPESGGGKRRTFAARAVPVVLKAKWVKPAKVVHRQAVPESMFGDAEAPRGFLDAEGRVVVEREERGRRR